MSAADASALASGCALCHDCHLLCALREHGAHSVLCPRCGAALHARKPRSLERATAYLVAAALC